VGNPLNALYEAVGWVLSRIYGVLSPVFGPSSGWTWALTIVILVVLMRLVMVPLFIKQMHTTRAMTSLQPQMAALRKRYKGDKQTLNQETMKLYQEAGVNPLMGCLPVVAQLPLFFSLFSVLKAIAEYTGGVPKYGLSQSMVESAKQAKILGVNIADKVLFTHGLSVPLHAKIVIVAAVLVSMVTTYLTVRQSMKRGMMPTATPDNPMGQSQKYMAYIMPFFALTGLYWPFGLVLYWVTTNLWTLVQQWALFKRYPYTPPSASTASTAAPMIGSTGARALAPKGSPKAPSPKTQAPGAKPAGTTGTKAPGAKPGGAKPAGTKAPGAKPAGAKPAGAKPAGTRPVGTVGQNGNGRAASSANGASGRAAANGGASPNGTGKSGTGKSATGTGGTGKTGAGQNGTGQGGTSQGGGMLRKLGRGRSEPEPQPEEAEVKLVRQQRQRQSRSKRSGKR
jgi:YidC/Oxa1 family membrane protein insertase